MNNWVCCFRRTPNDYVVMGTPIKGSPVRHVTMLVGKSFTRTCPASAAGIHVYDSLAMLPDKVGLFHFIILSLVPNEAILLRR